MFFHFCADVFSVFVHFVPLDIVEVSTSSFFLGCFDGMVNFVCSGRRIRILVVIESYLVLAGEWVLQIGSEWLVRIVSSWSNSACLSLALHLSHLPESNQLTLLLFEERSSHGGVNSLIVSGGAGAWGIFLCLW